MGLKETLAALRRGQGIPVGKKVLIVLDQFEQWLFACRGRKQQNTELVQSLRQCDGERLQCIVMVRDDFWMAATRFMRELEIRLIEAHNSAAVDLFDTDHARKVLAAFGTGLRQALPEQISDESTDEQNEFLNQAVSGLAQEGKVISVRLALFAEMMKGKAWTPTTLKEVGGTEGVGVTFLEETFSAVTASPEHRLHQKAARAVLKALLPESGTDIKGHMRSHADLLDESGYGDRPKDFDDLIRILDSEIRLITPTDPREREKEGMTEGGGRMKRANEQEVKSAGHGWPMAIHPCPFHPSDPSSPPSALKYYQLTHDYLVHSLRDWLTRKQKETRRGRAELRLFDISATWNSKPENRFLPSWWENLSIRFFTDKKKWTQPQRKMMAKAGRVHGLRSALALAGLVALVSIGAMVRTQVAKRQEATRIEGLVGRLVSAEPNQLPGIAKELDANPEVAATFLSPLVSSDAVTIDEKRSKLHARLATVARDKSLVEPLMEELLSNKVAYIDPIRQQLRPYASELTEKLWAVLRNEKAEAPRRLRAAVALADYVPDSEAPSWTDQDLKFVAEQLVSSNAEFQQLLRDALHSDSRCSGLLVDLERIFADARATRRSAAAAPANAFADYAALDIPKLSQLLAVATPEQFAGALPDRGGQPHTRHDRGSRQGRRHAAIGGTGLRGSAYPSAQRLCEAPQ